MSQTQTHLHGTALDMVELYANVNLGQSNAAFSVIDMEGRKLSPLVLAPNSVLVVTDVLATPNSAAGSYFADINNPIGSPLPQETRIRLLFDSRDHAMLHLALAGGVVFRKPPVAFAPSSNPGGMVIRLLGYLATL
jgi:hypothetical protein